MTHKISIFKHKVSYDKVAHTFKVSGKSVPFATEYLVENEKTGNAMVFKLSHSDGSEWDKKTKWYYHTDHKTFTLVVCNDDVTEEQKRNYLQAKLRNNG